MAKKKSKLEDEGELIKQEDAIDIMSSINDAIEKSTDPKELAFSLVAGYIWDREKLKMTSRLSQGQIVQLIKSYIIIRFYHNYWSQKTINHVFLKIDEPPYYRVKTDYEDLRPPEEYNIDFEEILKDIMELLIAKDGLGRKEAIEILKGAEKEITIKDKALSAVGL